MKSQATDHRTTTTKTEAHAPHRPAPIAAERVLKEESVGGPFRPVGGHQHDSWIEGRDSAAERPETPVDFDHEDQAHSFETEDDHGERDLLRLGGNGF